MNVGLSSLGRILGQIPKKIGAQVINGAALFLKREVRKNVPVDTGRLRRSVHIVRSSDFRTIVRTDVPYAEWNEKFNRTHSYFGKRAVQALTPHKINIGRTQ